MFSQVKSDIVDTDMKGLVRWQNRPTFIKCSGAFDHVTWPSSADETSPFVMKLQMFFFFFSILDVLAQAEKFKLQKNY